MRSEQSYQPAYPPYYPKNMMQPMYPPGVSSVASGGTIPGGTSPQTSIVTPGQLPIEQSYIENILRLNLGRYATIYMTYENNRQWNAKIFKGIIEAAGRDHIIISDPQTNLRTLLLMVNLDYINFEGELKYTY